MLHFTMLPKTDVYQLEDETLTIINEMLPKSQILYGNKDVLRMTYQEGKSHIRFQILCEEREGVVTVESQYRILIPGNLRIADIKEKLRHVTERITNMLQAHTTHRLKFVTGMWELHEQESQPF